MFDRRAAPFIPTSITSLLASHILKILDGPVLPTRRSVVTNPLPLLAKALQRILKTFDRHLPTKPLPRRSQPLSIRTNPLFSVGPFNCVGRVSSACMCPCTTIRARVHTNKARGCAFKGG
jgi:hypothetical protein